MLLYGGVFSGPSDDGDLWMEFLLRAQNIPYRRVTDRDLTELEFTPRYRLFLVPAGHYFEPTPTWAFGGESARARLRQAVTDGMNYFGICSGALIATPVCVYPSAISLHLTDVRPRWGGNPGVGVQFVTVRPNERVARLAALPEKCTRVWYHNGPIFRRYREPRYEAVAAFQPTSEEREQARGGFLFRKQLRGAAAVAEARCGNGRVVLCSPHFEYGDGSVWDCIGQLRGWIAEQHLDDSRADPLAPGSPGRRALMDTRGGRWMEPVRRSTNWRVLTALLEDLRARA